MVPPNCKYQKGSLLLREAGLYMGSTPATGVRDAIKLLKARQPNTRVLLELNGDLEISFAALNTQCIKDLVDDLGCDGVHAVWFSLAPNCRAVDGKVTCDSDQQSIEVVTKLREALPKGQYLLTAGTLGVGAFGEGEFAGSQPVSNYTGFDLAVARSRAGQSLDLVSVGGLGLGAGADLDRTESMRAHRALWPETPLVLGAHLRNANVNFMNGLTLEKVDEYAAAVAAQGFSGMNVWALLPAETTDWFEPRVQEVMPRACTALGLAGCEAPLPEFHAWTEGLEAAAPQKRDEPRLAFPGGATHSFSTAAVAGRG
jgi:chitinase